MDVIFYKFITLFCLWQCILSVLANPLITDVKKLYPSENSTKTYENIRSDQYDLLNDCDVEVELEHGDFMFLSNGNMFVIADNATYHPSRFRIIDGKMFMCVPEATTEYTPPILTCDTFEYEPHEFETLSNGSILLGEELLPDGIYKILDNGYLTVCTSEYDESDINGTVQGALGSYYEDTTLIYIGRIGSGISVTALTAHLVIFCIVPTLRNLPGYNLACFSVSLLIAYAFILIAQIPEVLGTSCIVSAIIQQNFFLSVFFWMNAMAFDVWRTLRLATEKLVVQSNTVKSKRFLCYCLYSWGCPFIITAISVVFDNSDAIPERFKPGYGLNDICWINNPDGKSLFFTLPSFVLFIMNALFYGLSARILFSNTMRVVSSDDRKSVKLNLVLYARIAVIMGMTWLLSLVAAYTRWRPIWYIFDILNSLQGLFVFLFFSCSRKVWQYLKKTPETASKESSKNTNSTGTKSESANRNSDIVTTSL